MPEAGRIGRLTAVDRRPHTVIDRRPEPSSIGGLNRYRLACQG